MKKGSVIKNGLLMLLFTGKLLSADFYNFNLGSGTTSNSFENDVPTRVYGDYAEINYGKNIFSNKTFGNLDYLTGIKFQKFNIGIGFDVTPKIEYNKGPFYLGLGIGLNFNNLKLDYFTYPIKWTPQLFTGLRFKISKTESISMGYTFEHFSHSYIGPTSNGKRNIGLNITDNKGRNRSNRGLNMDYIVIGYKKYFEWKK